MQLHGAEKTSSMRPTRTSVHRNSLSQDCRRHRQLIKRLHQMHKMFSHRLMKAKEFKGALSQETVPTHSSPTSFCHLYTVGHSWIQSKEKMSLIFRFSLRHLKLKLKVEDHCRTKHAITTCCGQACKCPAKRLAGVCVALCLTEC